MLFFPGDERAITLWRKRRVQTPPWCREQVALFAAKARLDVEGQAPLIGREAIAAFLEKTLQESRASSAKKLGPTPQGPGSNRLEIREIRQPPTRGRMPDQSG